MGLRGDLVTRKIAPIRRQIGARAVGPDRTGPLWRPGGLTAPKAVLASRNAGKMPTLRGPIDPPGPATASAVPAPIPPDAAAWVHRLRRNRQARALAQPVFFTG